jgi:hypothetical protein
MLGLLFAYRFLRTAHKENVFPTSSLTKFGTALVLANLSVFFVSITIYKAFNIIQMYPLFLEIIGISLIKKYQYRKIRASLLMVLTQTTLKMRVGASLRESLRLAIQDLSFDQQMILNEIFMAVFHQSQHEIHRVKDIHGLIKELVAINETKFRQVDQIQFLRDQIKQEIELRHKSRQATQQTKMQMIALSGMYLTLLIYVLISYDFTKTAQIISISGLLFALGLLIASKLGVKRSWKV